MSPLTRTLQRQIAVGVLSALLFGATIWFLSRGLSATRTEEKRLAQQRLLLTQVLAAVPAPSEQSRIGMEVDVASARRRLAALTALLAGTGVVAMRLQTIQSPATRTEAFFDLVGYVEGAREQAAQRGIMVASSAVNFGFSLYAHEGPEPGLIVAVFRQRLITQYLLDALFDARPGSLLALQRERPLKESERKARVESRAQRLGGGTRGPLLRPAETERSAPSADYFTPEIRSSAGLTSETIETQAFRFVFTGETDVLRAFVQRLAQFELPVFVRTIEVQPLEEEAKRPSVSRIVKPAIAASTVLTAKEVQRGDQADSPLRLVVPKTRSQFTVVVEFIEFQVEAVATSAVPSFSQP